MPKKGSGGRGTKTKHAWKNPPLAVPPKATEGGAAKKGQRGG